MLRVAISLCVLFLCSPCGAQAGKFGVRLDGTPLPRLADRGAKAVVLFFVATDCPVSNRTFPEMERLRETYSAQGIRFWFVYPNADEKPDDIFKHQIAFDAEGDAIADPDARLVQLTHAFVTPEAAILVPAAHLSWKTVYVGRIDDRFVHIGLQRQQPTALFVDRALKALLAGQPIVPDTGTPVGCTILPARKLKP
jgi:hypothetical protein